MLVEATALESRGSYKYIKDVFVTLSMVSESPRVSPALYLQKG